MSTTTASSRRGTFGRVMDKTGAVIAWIWEKVAVILFLVIVAWIVWAFVGWHDNATTTTMKQELDKRGFKDIVVIHEPTMAQTRVFALAGKANDGVYSAQAGDGNCRVTITTPGGVPTVTIKSQVSDKPDTILSDADVLKLSKSLAARSCFG